MSEQTAEVAEVMVDLETTGIKPGCHIASIGACTFGGNKMQPRFYFHDFAKTEDPRFQANQETLLWWSQKPLHIFDQVFKGTKKIDAVLIDFAQYLDKLGPFQIWGNAASFDLKILEKAYEICNLPVPWDFRNEMCYRTLKRIYPQIPYRKPKDSHVALEDAIAQANHAEEILAYKKAVEIGYLQEARSHAASILVATAKEAGLYTNLEEKANGQAG